MSFHHATIAVSAHRLRRAGGAPDAAFGTPITTGGAGCGDETD